MNTQDENQDTARTPFPEPQTIPYGWDTSGLSSAPQPVSDEQEDDSAEN